MAFAERALSTAAPDPPPIAAFRPGIAKLAQARPHLVIVPLWLGNMGRSLPKGEFFPIPMTCDIRVGEPRRCTGDAAAIMAELEAAVRALGENDGAIQGPGLSTL